MQEMLLRNTISTILELIIVIGIAYCAINIGLRIYKKKRMKDYVVSRLVTEVQQIAPVIYRYLGNRLAHENRMALTTSSAEIAKYLSNNASTKIQEMPDDVLEAMVKLTVKYMQQKDVEIGIGPSEEEARSYIMHIIDQKSPNGKPATSSLYTCQLIRKEEGVN